MRGKFISAQSFGIMSGSCGLAGVLLIITSFAINPGPPPGTSILQLQAFADQNHRSILWGAWLQTVGPVLIILFAFSLVRMAGFTNRLAGWMTFFGATVLMMVNLIEVTFYIAALFKEPAGTGLIAIDLIAAVQHLYFIVAAPALFIPLGFIILRSGVLPRIFALLAFVLGILFFMVGIMTMTDLVIPPPITMLGIFQGLWWLAASITFIIRSGKMEYHD